MGREAYPVAGGNLQAADGRIGFAPLLAADPRETSGQQVGDAVNKARGGRDGNVSLCSGAVVGQRFQLVSSTEKFRQGSINAGLIFGQ
jgi:hypothetical protein